MIEIDWRTKTVYNKKNGFKVLPEIVIKRLNEFITDERKDKIENILSQRSSYFIPVLENVCDKGNISAVMRSAEAFGFYRFHIIKISKDFKESKRVTQGADKWLDVSKWTNTKDCILTLKESGYRVYTTHLSKKAVEFDELDLNQKTAVIFGNERDGVSKEALSLAHGNVLLPMAGFTQSFNISVAGALSFQRAFFKNPPKIDEEEKKLLKAVYFLRTITWPEKALCKIFSD